MRFVSAAAAKVDLRTRNVRPAARSRRKRRRASVSNDTRDCDTWLSLPPLLLLLRHRRRRRRR